MDNLITSWLMLSGYLIISIALQILSSRNMGRFGKEYLMASFMLINNENDIDLF